MPENSPVVVILGGPNNEREMNSDTSFSAVSENGKVVWLQPEETLRLLKEEESRQAGKAGNSGKGQSE